MIKYEFLEVLAMIRHTISMPEMMSEHIMSLISEGHYGGISDYLRDLVRRDLVQREKEQKEATILALKKLIAEGEASGIGSKSMREIKAEARKELDL